MTGKPSRISNSISEKIIASHNHNVLKPKDQKSVAPFNIQTMKSPYTPKHSEMFNLLYKVK